jgi:hypothetical protein
MHRQRETERDTATESEALTIYTEYWQKCTDTLQTYAKNDNIAFLKCSRWDRTTTYCSTAQIQMC